MPIQGGLTLTIGILGIAIPLILLYTTVKMTRPVPVACPRCDGDVPPTSVKCPNCGSVVPNQDQPL